jgi:hypothetical protein
VAAHFVCGNGLSLYSGDWPLRGIQPEARSAGAGPDERSEVRQSGESRHSRRQAANSE